MLAHRLPIQSRSDTMVVGQSLVMDISGVILMVSRCVALSGSLTQRQDRGTRINELLFSGIVLLIGGLPL